MPEEVMQSLSVKQLTLGSYPAASLPANAADGTIAYDNTNNKLVVMANGSWETVTSA